MMKKALATSASLHVVTLALLGGLRATMPISPNVIMVEMMESGLPPAERAAAPKAPARPAIKPAPEPSAPSSPSTFAPTLAQPAASPATAETLSVADGPDVVARKLTLEEAYVAAVRRELEKQKNYPPVARRLGQTGRVTLRFKVGSDGSVLESQLVSKSAFQSLNESAEGMLGALKKFQPIPAELKKLSWEFTVPIEYRLE